MELNGLKVKEIVWRIGEIPYNANYISDFVQGDTNTSLLELTIEDYIMKADELIKAIIITPENKTIETHAEIKNGKALFELSPMMLSAVGDYSINFSLNNGDEVIWSNVVDEVYSVSNNPLAEGLPAVDPKTEVFYNELTEKLDSAVANIGETTTDILNIADRLETSVAEGHIVTEELAIKVSEASDFQDGYLTKIETEATKVLDSIETKKVDSVGIFDLTLNEKTVEMGLVAENKIVAIQNASIVAVDALESKNKTILSGIDIAEIKLNTDIIKLDTKGNEVNNELIVKTNGYIEDIQIAGNQQIEELNGYSSLFGKIEDNDIKYASKGDLLTIDYSTIINKPDVVDGAKGDKGDQGIQGEQGIQGLRGLQGDQGILGVKGDTGQNGIQGERGIQGIAGKDGIIGVDGAKGEKGDTGEQGIQGLSIYESYVKTYGYTGSENQFINERIKGEQGVNGDTGDQGLQGVDGVKGAQGVKGDTGIQGIQGLKGDKGDAGNDGVQGVKGDTGTKGDTGEQGIQGLKGEQGIAGLDGEQGIQGIQGVKGDQGEQGIQGERGLSGDADLSNYVEQVELNSLKDYYFNNFETKADKTSLTTKADVAYVNSELEYNGNEHNTMSIHIQQNKDAIEGKVDKDYVDTELLGKVNKLYVDLELDTKAEKSYVDAIGSNLTNLNIEVQTKADMTSLDTKADVTYVDSKIAGIVNTAPETLDTLNELATALGNDPNFATTIATEIGAKESTAEVDRKVAVVDSKLVDYALKSEIPESSVVPTKLIDLDVPTYEEGKVLGIQSGNPAWIDAPSGGGGSSEPIKGRVMNLASTRFSIWKGEMGSILCENLTNTYLDRIAIKDKIVDYYYDDSEYTVCGSFRIVVTSSVHFTDKTDLTPITFIESKAFDHMCPGLISWIGADLGTMDNISILENNNFRGFFGLNNNLNQAINGNTLPAIQNAGANGWYASKEGYTSYYQSSSIGNSDLAIMSINLCNEYGTPNTPLWYKGVQFQLPTNLYNNEFMFRYKLRLKK